MLCGPVVGTVARSEGFVTVDSVPGRGTKVCVRRIRRRSCSEDEDAVRELMARTLRRARYRVLTAATPDEAVARFDRYIADVSLVVTDVVMRQLRGSALAEIFQARLPGLPVLFVSGYSQAVPAAAAAKGPVSFLAKPFSAAKLLSEVSALMAATRS